MDFYQIPRDDVQDIVDVMNKIDPYVKELIQEDGFRAVFSALLNTCINCMLSQARTLEEIELYRNGMVRAIDHAIKAIRIKSFE